MGSWGRTQSKSNPSRAALDHETSASPHQNRRKGLGSEPNHCSGGTSPLSRTVTTPDDVINRLLGDFSGELSVRDFRVDPVACRSVHATSLVLIVGARRDRHRSLRSGGRLRRANFASSASLIIATVPSDPSRFTAH